MKQNIVNNSLHMSGSAQASNSVACIEAGSRDSETHVFKVTSI